MKIGTFSTRADYEAAEPIEFEPVQMPDNGHIVDAKIILGHKSAQLHLNVVHDVNDKLVPMTMIALLLGQEHEDVREYEFVQKVRTHKFTSEVPAYYLFTAPRT
jgi:hypothetical protein